MARNGEFEVIRTLERERLWLIEPSVRCLGFLKRRATTMSLRRHAIQRYSTKKRISFPSLQIQCNHSTVLLYPHLIFAATAGVSYLKTGCYNFRTLRSYQVLLWATRAADDEVWSFHSSETSQWQ